MTVLGKLRRSLWGKLPKGAAAFKQGNTRAAQHLGKIFFTVIGRYHATLEDSRLEVLVPKLNEIEPELRGFAYEGAAIGLTGLDCMLPWQNRLLPFLAGPASPYIYPAYVGSGVALARLGKRPEKYLTRLDPILCWLLVDGYGWRYGIFSRSSSIEKQEIPEHLSPYAQRAFDHGLGRSIWFSTNANVEDIARIIATFPETRQADLWSGIGFACAYAGGMDRTEIEALRQVSDSYWSHLAMGVAVGTKGRQRAGNLAPHTELACEILCCLSAHEAAHITDVALQYLPTDRAEPAYEIWRQRIREQFVLSTERVMSNEAQLVQQKVR